MAEAETECEKIGLNRLLNEFDGDMGMSVERFPETLIEVCLLIESCFPILAHCRISGGGFREASRIVFTNFRLFVHLLGQLFT